MLIKLFISLLIISFRVQGDILLKSIQGSKGSPSGFNEIECGFNETEYGSNETKLEGVWIWSKGNETIMPNDQFNIILLNISRSRLIMKNYIENYNEKVVCEFKSNLNFTLNATIEFWEPKIVDSNRQKRIEITENSNQTFTCELEAIGVEYVNERIFWSWEKNNEKLNLDDENNAKSYSLIVKKSDQGVYTCQPYMNGGPRNIFSFESKRTFNVLVNSKINSHIGWIYFGFCIEVVVVCILIALYEKVYSKKNVNEYTFSHDMDHLKNHVKS